MAGSPSAYVDRLRREAASEPLSGSDFSRLAGRVVSGPLLWDDVAPAMGASDRAGRASHRLLFQAVRPD